MRPRAVGLALLLIVGTATFLAVPPVPGVAESADDTLRFRDASADAGLAYESVGRRGAGQPKNEGVYVADVDRDGWPDVLLVGGARPVLFENTGGAFERSGALPAEGIPYRAVNAALFFDRDGDGWPDLLLLAQDAPPIYLENVGGSFERRDVGFAESLSIPMGATAADHDGDGRLDLFVIQQGDWAETVPAGFRHPERDVRNDNGNPNVLYRNTGDGFERIENAGIDGARWSLAASFVDLTGDGRPDIHVANDFNNDTLYRNRGNGTFERVVLGGATDRNAMSSEVADVTGNGRPDVFVTNIYVPRVPAADTNEKRMVDERARVMSRMERMLNERLHGNNLLVNGGGGRLVDRAGEYGVRKGGWGWAASAADFDNDGDRDLFHATQRMDAERRQLSIVAESSPYLATPMLWERTDDGFARVNATRAGFSGTDGRGVAALDFDRDGDRDLLLATYGGAFKLYENVGRTGNWLDIDVRGTRTTPATGARVYVTAGGETRLLVRNARADYLSQDSRILHAGLGDHDTADVRVVWPDGTERTVEDVAANRRLIVRPDGTAATRTADSGGAVLDRLLDRVAAAIGDLLG